MLSGQACCCSRNRSRRLIERSGELNCAVPSAHVVEPARHETLSKRPGDEQMCAGVCAHMSVSLYFGSLWIFFFLFKDN